MVDRTPPEDLNAYVTRVARGATVERLALISTVIWAVGALLFYVFVIYPYSAKPSTGMLGGLALLVPAALPWLAYPRLVRREVANRLQHEPVDRADDSGAAPRPL